MSTSSWSLEIRSRLEHLLDCEAIPNQELSYAISWLSKYEQDAKQPDSKFPQLMHNCDKLSKVFKKNQSIFNNKIKLNKIVKNIKASKLCEVTDSRSDENSEISAIYEIKHSNFQVGSNSDSLGDDLSFNEDSHSSLSRATSANQLFLIGPMTVLTKLKSKIVPNILTYEENCQKIRMQNIEADRLFPSKNNSKIAEQYGSSTSYKLHQSSDDDLSCIQDSQSSQSASSLSDQSSLGSQRRSATYQPYKSCLRASVDLLSSDDDSNSIRDSLSSSDQSSLTSQTKGRHFNRASLHHLTTAEKYCRIRIQNNEASKRFRQKKKCKLAKLQAEAEQLQALNMQLKDRLTKEKSKIDLIKSMLISLS